MGRVAFLLRPFMSDSDEVYTETISKQTFAIAIHSCLFCFARASHCPLWRKRQMRMTQNEWPHWANPVTPAEVNLLAVDLDIPELSSLS